MALAVGGLVLAATLMWYGAGSMPGATPDRQATAQEPTDPSPAAMAPEEPVGLGPARQAPAADLSGTPAPAVVASLPDAPRVERSLATTGASHQGKTVALTVDDNYEPERALPVLRALAKVRAPATVFLTGGPTRSYPEVTAQIARNPLLEVADHAATHVELTGMSRDGLEAEVGAGVAAFREMTGRHTSRLFRPPGGHYDAAVLEVAGEKGFPWTVGFSPGPADYVGLPAREVLHGIVSGDVTPGSLVLLHFNGGQTAELIPELVGTLRARGYRLGTVSQLLKGQERFLDLASTDPGYPAALALDRADVVNGYSTGDYGTWEPMSRVDLAWALVHLLEPVAGTSPAGLDPAPAGGPSLGFVDVVVTGEGPVAPLSEVSAEQRAAIERCVRAGLMQGGTDAAGSAVFWPWSSVRRIDLALAAATALGSLLPAGSPAVPADVPGEVPAEAGRVVARVAEVGLMDVPAAGFGPLEPVGRLQATLVLYRLAEVVRPGLVGARGLPEWWRGPR